MRPALAYHEAAHAVMAHYLGLKITEISMATDPAFVSIDVDKKNNSEKWIMFLLAGDIVERRLDPSLNFEEHTPLTSHDMFEVRLALYTAFDSREINKYPADDEDLGFELAEHFQKPLYVRLRKKVRRILSKPSIWSQVTALAAVLLESASIDETEAVRIIEGVAA